MVTCKRTTAIVEGADYLLDMEGSSHWKKKGNGATLNRPPYDVELFDETYISFLDDLQEYWEAKTLKDEDEDEDDPLYMMFLENLKEHGNAYMLDVSRAHGVTFPIIYEDEDDLPDKLKRKNPSPFKGDLIRETRGLDLDDDLKLDDNNSGSRKDKTQRHSLINKNRSSVLYEPKSGLDNSGPGKENTQRSQPPRRKNIVRKPTRSSEGNSEANTIDESYRIFMSGLKVVGDSVFYEYGDGKRVYYEGNDEQRPTNAEVESHTASTTRSQTLRPPTPTQVCTPSAPNRIDDQGTSSAAGNALKNNGENSNDYSWFFKRLKRNLRKPYVQEEFEDLWKWVDTRKPVIIHRESRSGGSVRQGHMGKSLLDSYPDLDVEIKKVKSDDHKVLNLLRSFKFYIENLPHGVPIPWKDDLFKKKVILGS